MSEITIRDVNFEDLRRVSEIVVESWKTAYRGIVADEYLESLTNGVGKKIINYVMNDFETTDYIGRSAGVVTLEGEKKIFGE